MIIIKNNWFKLDNAAKIFPPVSNKKDPKVFRFAVELTEKIIENNLVEALDKTLLQFPNFKVVLKRGLFWYYLEDTKINPVVTEEYLPICSPIYNKTSKTLLFRVNYYKNRINLEVYHALTDGTGALEFFKTLISYYIIITNKEDFKDDYSIIIPDSSIMEKQADSFEKYYKREKYDTNIKYKRAYQFRSERLRDYSIRIIEGHVSLNKILDISHKKNTTITCFIVALYLKAISNCMNLSVKNKMISLDVPVNLRKYFKSSTARNFFSVLKVTYDASRDLTLDEIIDHVNNIFKEELKIEKVKQRMNHYAKVEHNFVIRLVPLFIKNIVLNIAYLISNKTLTASVSNIGKIELDECFNKYIKTFDIFASTYKQQICMCSYKDVLSLSITSSYLSTEVIREFFNILSSYGIDIEIISNIIDE